MAAVDEVDIGFEINTEVSSPKELDLCLTKDQDDVDVLQPNSELCHGDVPNLLKYLAHNDDSEVLLPETSEPVSSQNGFGEDHPREDEPSAQMTQNDNLLKLDARLSSEELKSFEPDTDKQSVLQSETSAPPALDVTEKSEVFTSGEEDNQLANILSDVLNNVSKTGEVLEVNVSDSINLVNGFSSLDVAETKDRQLADKTFTNEAANTFVVCDVGEERINSEISTEQSKMEEDVDDDIQEVEIIPVPALKNDTIQNDDDDDFAFEIPEKADGHFDISHIKSRISEFDSQLSALHSFKTDSPITEPYEELQQQIQKVLIDGTNCQTKLNTLLQLIKTVPSKHEEYESIMSWYNTSADRLNKIQQQAQIRLSDVLEAINEKQAKILAATTESPRSPGGSRDLQAAEEEWAKVQSVTPEIGSEISDGKRATKVSTIPSVGYTDILNTAKSTFNLIQYEQVIKTSIQRRGFNGLIHKLFGTKLHKSLQNEQKLVFCLAACPYQDDIPCHWHVLHTIYRRLTGAKVDTPRYGGHWETIGFQGNDPATDLRGSGFLGLLQLLYMLSDPALLPLAKEMYKLSLHETQNFPFCIMGINITRIVLQVLREDHLNKECNKRKQVLDVVNEFYMALWFRLFTIWKTQHKTIKDTGFVFSEIETTAKKRPHALLTSLNNHLAQQQSQARVHDNKEEFKFQAVCDLDDD